MLKLNKRRVMAICHFAEKHHYTVMWCIQTVISDNDNENFI